MKITTLAAIAGTALVAFTTSAHAGNVVLTLSPTNVTNVNDAAGFNQIEAGQLQKGTALIGYYTITRRVSTGGTTPQNVGAETVTLILLGSTASNTSPPQNIWLQGVHAFSNGNATGSVSAASANYDWIRNASYTKTGPTAASLGKLTITWNASNTLTVP